MNGSTGFYVGVADSVLLLGLWSALVAGPRKLRVPFALASFWWACGLAFLLCGFHAPTWAIVASGGAIAISLVVLITTVQLSARGNSGGSGGEDSDGGLGSRPPERPSGGGGPAEPTWWPEFERDLRLYMSERDSAKQEPRREPVGA